MNGSTSVRTSSLILSVSERKYILLEEIKHEKQMLELSKAVRKHAERIEHLLNEEQKTREKRALAADEHERVNQKNSEARLVEVEARQAFLKKSLQIL